MRSASSPNHPGKGWYEELCALAAIGELSSSEYDELRKHLAECEDCRQVYADFRRVSAGELGFVAALKQSERTAAEARGPVRRGERLRKSLTDAQAKYTALEAQQRSLEAELASERAQLDQKGQEIEAARSTTEDKNKEIAQLEARVQAAVRRTEDQRSVAADLQTRLQYMQQQVQQQAANTPESQGFGDAEAKELFGARDLHLVDVYDVDIKGNTRRSY